MDSIFVKQYFDEMRTMEGEECLHAYLAFHIAPTISKKKPANIISLHRRDQDFYSLWDQYGNSMGKKLGIKSFLLKEKAESKTIFFYNEEILAETVYKEKALNVLKNFGYSSDMELVQLLEVLKKRFNEGCPHEMGIFLGIPIDDVLTYIEQPKRKFLLCRYWRVYHNEEKARKIFNDFDFSRIEMMKAVLQRKKAGQLCATA